MNSSSDHKHIRDHAPIQGAAAVDPQEALEWKESVQSLLQSAGPQGVCQIMDMLSAMARRIIEAWRIDYNGHRPHTSLGGLTPNEFAARSREGHNPNGFWL